MNVTNERCGTGCLRLELDEMGDGLVEVLDEIENALESEDEPELTAQQRQRFERDINDFTAELIMFRTECGQCTNFRRNGKGDEFSRILQRARLGLVKLSQLKQTDQTGKEGELCEAN